MIGRDLTIAGCYFDSGPKWWEARCRHCGVLLTQSEAGRSMVEIEAQRVEHLCTQLEYIELLRGIKSAISAIGRRIP